MAVNLAPGPFGVGGQFFSGNIPLNGGLIYTYAAGTTTPLATFTTNSLTLPVANGNPIILNSQGILPQEMWLTAGLAYKFIVTDSVGNVIFPYTMDNIVGINDFSSIPANSEWTETTLKPTFINATSFSLPGDQTVTGTGTMVTGRRLKILETAGTVYATVTSSSVLSSVTTVNVTVDSGQVIDSGISDVSYGILSPLHVSIPQYILGSSTVTVTYANGIPTLSASIIYPAVSVIAGKMSVTAAATTATFTASEIVSESALGSTSIKSATYSQPVNLANTGAGGMDVGQAPISGYVCLYAIFQANGTASILACNRTTSSGPVYTGANLPATYVYSALLTIWPTDASRQFKTGFQIGRKVDLQPAISVFTATVGPVTMTTQSLSTAVPLEAVAVDIVMASTSTTTSGMYSVGADVNGTGGASQASSVLGATKNMTLGISASAGAVSFKDVPLITAQTVFWMESNTSGGNSMWICAYTF